MPDPLGEVPAGKLSPFVGSFSTVSTALDLLRKMRREGQGEVGSPSKKFDPVNPTCEVWIRNDSGAALDAFSIVKIGDAVTNLDDEDSSVFEFAEGPMFSGTTPASTTDAFAILSDPIDYPGGGVYRYGKAVVLGVVPVDVNVTDAGHNYATPTASDNTQLTSAASGPARILYKPSGTGTLRCAVKLDESAAGSSSITSRQSVAIASNYNITGSATWNDLGGTVPDITVPATGAWILYTFGYFAGKVSAGMGTGSYYGSLAIRIYSETRTINLTPHYLLCSPSVANVVTVGNACTAVRNTLDAGEVIRLEALRDSGPTWTTAEMRGDLSGSAGLFGFGIYQLS